MPYPADHKPRVRHRIVRAAAALFSEHGFRATSVQKVMTAVGLTHGGFYAHFKDKSALFAAALDAAFLEAQDNLLNRGLDDFTGTAWLLRAQARYLTMRHRDAPETGCAIPTLAAEAAIAQPEVRDAFEAGLRQMIEGMADRLEGAGFDCAGVADHRAEAIRRLALWSGALSMSRAVGDDFAAEILTAARGANAPDVDQSSTAGRVGVKMS